MKKKHFLKILQPKRVPRSHDKPYWKIQSRVDVICWIDIRNSHREHFYPDRYTFLRAYFYMLVLWVLKPKLRPLRIKKTI